jgi:hypothetical protein
MLTRQAVASSSGKLAAAKAPSVAVAVAPLQASAPGASAAAAAALAAALFIFNPGPALAIGPVAVKLGNIRAERVDCARGTATVGGVSFSGASTAAACIEVKSTATNPSKRMLYSADVFGRLYDATGESMLDASENARIAYIDELAPGTSEVSFVLRVPAGQFDKGPAEFKNFKASAFEGKNLPGQAGLLQGSGGAPGAADGDCEVTGTCDEEALEAMIR